MQSYTAHLARLEPETQFYECCWAHIVLLFPMCDQLSVAEHLERSAAVDRRNSGRRYFLTSGKGLACLG